MLWPILLGLYAAGVTALCALLYRRRRERDDFASQVERLAGEGGSALDKIKAAAELAKARQGQLAWYEKSLSAMGVVAFFSMVIATGFQTLRAGFESYRVEQLQASVETLEERQEDLVEVLGSVSQVLLEKSRRGEPLDPAERRILRQRLELLEELPQPTGGEVREKFELAFELGDVITALDILEEEVPLLDDTAPLDQLTIAEYAYLAGSPATAREQLEKLRPNLSRLPTWGRVRSIVLRAALDPENDEAHANELAAALKIGAGAARRRLHRETSRLRQAAHQVEGMVGSEDPG